MSEDIQTEVSEVAEQSTPEVVDSYTQQAVEQGWKPKAEYQGDPDKWKEAKEFVERGELFKKIDTMGKELKETRRALQMLKEHHNKVKEVEYSKAVNELKQLQKKHLEEGNSDGYLETTELLTDLKAEQKAREVVQEGTPTQPDPRFVSWVTDNKWYNSDPEMRQFADAVGMGYAQTNRNLSPEDVLAYVSKEVKERFKDKFVNPNRTKSTLVGSSNTSAGTSTKNDIELTDDERRVMNTFIRTGVLTKEEYLSEIKRMRSV
jgi:hypothetical protein